MNRAVQFFRGTYRIRITGAEPQRCINRFFSSGVSVWEVQRQDDYCWLSTIPKRQWAAAKQSALQCQCELEIVQESGLYYRFGGLLRRPVLLLMLLLIALSMIVLPNFIWVLEVEGNDVIPRQRILQELEDLGIGFGTWIPSLPEPLQLRYEMQLRIPELQWIAVNCTGGKASVLVAEREPYQNTVSKRAVCNLIACRDGVIQEMIILNGFAVCQVGQAVRKGELLVSGYMDHVLTTQATRAMGEVYALTQHKIRAVTPAATTAKQPNGEKSRCIFLNIGRNQIKIFGSSGISVSECDKISVKHSLTLPNGYCLPFGITVQTNLHYDSTEEKRPEDGAMSLLETAARRRLMTEMIAGEVQTDSFALSQSAGAYVLDMTAWCREMIARPEAATILFTKEDDYGADHQRRTN